MRFDLDRLAIWKTWVEDTDQSAGITCHTAACKWYRIHDEMLTLKCKSEKILQKEIEMHVCPMTTYFGLPVNLDGDVESC